MAKAGYVSSKAAYYEGLQYANKNVEPVDFGSLAMGMADVAKEKYERDERARKERENFELKIIEDFPGIIHPAFDKTGLKNADIYVSNVSEMVSSRSQDLNDRFNKGEISNIQYRREMTKLKGQAQQLTNNIGMIGTYVQKVREAGDNIDPASEDTMEHLNNLFQNSKPYLSEDNRIGNISVSQGEDGEESPESFLWDEAASMLEVENKYDTFTIPKQILNIQGELSKFIGSDAVINTHLDKSGNLRQETSDLLRQSIGTLSDRQVISYARQNGFKVEKDKKNINNLINRQELESKIFEDSKDKTLSVLKQKQSLDEVEKTKIDVALQDSYLRQKKMSSNDRAKRGYNYSYYTKDNAESEGIGLSGDVEEFTVTKEIPLKNIPLTDLKLTGQISADAIESGVVKQMHRNSSGDYMVTIGYVEKIPGDYKGDFTEVPQVRKVFLNTRAQKNYFLTKIDPTLGVITDPIPKAGEEPKEKPKAY